MAMQETNCIIQSSAMNVEAKGEMTAFVEISVVCRGDISAMMTK
jgi:hypothetical protein